MRQRILSNYRSDLERAKELLSKAEKRWLQRNSSSNICNESRSMGETAAKSDYMIKLITENEALRKKVQEIETKSRTCFHGKSVLIQSQVWSLKLRRS